MTATAVVAKWWRTHGPTLRWHTFRLVGDPPNDRWLPLKVAQIFGGRTWSVCITRNGPYHSEGGDES